MERPVYQKGDERSCPRRGAPPPAPAEPQGPDLLSARDLQAVDSASLLETGPCWERRVGSLQDSGIQT